MTDSPAPVLARDLPRLGIPSCYLSLYEDPKSPTEWSRLILAYDKRGRVELESGGRRFPSRQLAPGGMYRRENCWSMSLEPIYFRENQLGFALLEVGPQQAEICEALRMQFSSALQKTLLVLQVQSRAIQLQVAAEVSRAASSILDPDELLRQVVTLVRERFNLYYVGLFLVDQTGEWAVLRAGTGEAGQAMLKQGHKLEINSHSMIGWCVANKQARTHAPARSAGVALDVGQEAVHFENPLLPQTRSELALPLISRGAAIGALTIQSAQPAAFSSDDVVVFQTMADQVAVALENARLFEQTQARTEWLAVVNRIAKVASATLHLDDLMEAVYREITPAFQPDAFFIALYDQETNELDMHFVVDEGVQRPPERVPLGTGLTSIVVTEKKPLIIRDEQELARLLPSARIVGSMKPAVSWVGAPLLAGERVLGVINIQSYRPDVWDEEDEQLLFTVADQVAVALENARLFERAQQATLQMRGRVQEMDALNDIGRKIDETPSIPEFLQWAAERIPPAMQYPDVCQVAIEFEGQVYGAAEAVNLPRQIVQSLRMGGQVVGRICIAYTEEHDFLNEESALLGDIDRRVSGYIESRHLFEEARSRADELAVLNELSQSLTARLNVEQVLEETYRQASRLLDTTNFFIAFYVAERNEVNIAFEVLESERYKQVTAFPANQGFTGYVVRNRTSLLVPDKAREWEEKLGVVMPGGMRLAVSWLGAPLIVGDQVIGAIVVRSFTTPHAFSEHDRDLLTAIASQMAIAVQNTRLYEQAQVRAEELTVLNEMSRTLTGVLNVDTVIENIYHYASRLLDTTNFYVALHNPETDEVSFPLAFEHGRQANWKSRQAAHGMTEYVIRTREPLLIKERVAARLEELGIARVGQEAQSWLGVPLMVGQRVIGMVAVQTYTTPRLYNEHHYDLLSSIANQAAIAIENASLFEQTRARAERERTIREISDKVQRATDMETLARITAEELNRALGGSRAYVRLGTEALQPPNDNHPAWEIA